MGLIDDFKNMMKAAKDMQDAYVEHGTLPGAPGIDPTRLMPPPSAFVKRQTCTSCGAPKQLPSVREYLYCDFCGQLLDFDLRLASINAHTNPDATTYAQAANQAGPMAAEALKRNDRDHYLRLQAYLFEMQATYTRWAVPPRAWNDERYRQRWITFQAESMTAYMFDPAYRDLDSKMRRRALTLRWRQVNPLKMATHAIGGDAGPDPFPKVSPDSFWPLLDVLLEQHERGRVVASIAGLHQLDPDDSPDLLSDRMLRSGIAQGWLKYLDPDAGQELIGRLGLDHQYARPEVTADQKGCGGCGGTMQVAPGAKVVVCDGCGRKLDLGSSELECIGCGGHIVLADGQPTAQCPFCRAEVRRT